MLAHRTSEKKLRDLQSSSPRGGGGGIELYGGSASYFLAPCSISLLLLCKSSQASLKGVLKADPSRATISFPLPSSRSLRLHSLADKLERWLAIDLLLSGYDLS